MVQTLSLLFLYVTRKKEKKNLTSYNFAIVSSITVETVAKFRPMNPVSVIVSKHP